MHLSNGITISDPADPRDLRIWATVLGDSQSEQPTDRIGVTVDGHEVGDIGPAKARRLAVELLTAADAADGGAGTAAVLAEIAAAFDGLLLTGEQLNEMTWGEWREMSVEQRTRLVDAIPRSSIPEALQTIAGTLTDSDEDSDEESGEAVLSRTDSAFRATFDPQAWIGDEAVSVDPEGPTSWDCTAAVRADWDYFAGLFGDRPDLDLAMYGVIDNDDVLQRDPAAPEWVREWRGPFTITVYLAD